MSRYYLFTNDDPYNQRMAIQHTLRIRGPLWESIEKRAWKLSQEADKFIKPTDVADAILRRYIKEITLSDIEIAKNERNLTIKN